MRIVHNPAKHPKRTAIPHELLFGAPKMNYAEAAARPGNLEQLREADVGIVIHDQNLLSLRHSQEH